MFKNLLLAFVASTSAHASFEDDPDAELLTNREGRGSPTLESSGRVANLQTESQNYHMWYKFSDEA